MRLLFLIVIAIALVALVAGQEVSRRERLRNLIAAARGGDREARNTLRNLRNKLRNRAKAGNNQPQPAPEPRALDIKPIQEQVVKAQPQPQPEPEQQTQSFVPVPRTQKIQRQNLRSPIQERPQSFQRQPEDSSLFEPHRALNRGLEVDSRSEANAVIRVTNKTKTPPIQTIRRYSYFDDEGNYIFGYEGADGSFKEEKRGLDCIVHGKYGYVDPDGVKREFTYVSGNQCDPNAPADPEVQNTIPLNDQFLIQTQDQTNRARKPVPKPARKPAPKPTPTVAPRPIPQRSPVQRQRPQRISSRRQNVRTQTVRTEPTRSFVKEEVRTENVHQAPEPKPIKEPQPQVIKDEFPQIREPVPERKPEKKVVNPLSHFSPAQFKQPSKAPSFRPTPRPLDFNFEQEFQQIFSNFANDRPRQVFRPRAQPTAAAPKPRPTPAAPRPKPTPAPPKPVVTKAPAPKPVRTEAPSVPHQLVFDSATGSFKTVALGTNFNAVPSVRKHPLPAPAPAPAAAPALAPKSPSVGIPLAGLNPLPPVPIGSLTFNRGGSNNAAAQFDNFFRQFNV